MGLNLGHVLGEFQQFAAKIQTDKDTYVPPLTTDFLKVISTDFGLSIPRSERDDASEGLDDYETVTEKSEISATIERWVTPSGTLGTAPAESLLLRAMMGAAPTGEGGGVSVVYGLGTANIALSLMRRYNAFAPTIMEALYGFALEEGKLTVSGGEKPKWTFSGRAIGHIATGKSEVSTDSSSSTTLLLVGPTGYVTTKPGRGFDVGGRVKIGSATNGGVGYAIAARADDQVTLGTALSATDGQAVVPYCPDPTHVGAVLGHTQGSFVVDSQTWPITACEISVKRNLTVVADEFGAAGMTDAILGRRKITGKVTIRAREDFVNHLSARKDFASRALVLTLGATSTKKVTVSCPYLLCDVDKLTVGQSGPGTFDIPFRALASADGASDALVITYL